MSRMKLFLACLAASAIGVGLSGCGGADVADQAAAPVTQTQADADAGHDEHGHEHAEGDHEGHDHGDGDHDEHAGHDHDDAGHAGHDHDAAEVPAAFAELSEEDRTLAMAQKICPVSDEALGLMGTPFKVTVKERTVFLCCEECEDEINEDPDKYLAKLDK